MLPPLHSQWTFNPVVPGSSPGRPTTGEMLIDWRDNLDTEFLMGDMIFA